ncbi:MAG: hypothetical protein R3F43_22940 [bacterium]
MTRALLAAAFLAAAGFLAWRWSRPVSAPPAGERVVPTPPHEGRVSAVLPGSPVVSGDVTGRLVLWSEAGPTTFVAHDGAVRRLLRAGDGFASVGADGSVAFWGMDGAARRRLRLSEEPLNDAWIVGADVLASTARGTVARLADAGPVWKARGAHARTAFTVALQGSTVWSGGADGRVATWDLQSGASATGFEPGLGFIVALFPEGDGVLAVGQQGWPPSVPPGSLAAHGSASRRPAPRGTVTASPSPARPAGWPSTSPMGPPSAASTPATPSSASPSTAPASSPAAAPTAACASGR